MQAEELSADQQAAVAAFADACTQFMQAMQRLDELDLDMGSALRAIPSPDDPGRSLYDELPGHLKMML